MEEKVWIVLYTEHETGIESILGVFRHPQNAKIFIAEYALNNDIDTYFLQLVEKEVK